MSNENLWVKTLKELRAIKRLGQSVYIYATKGGLGVTLISESDEFPGLVSIPGPEGWDAVLSSELHKLSVSAQSYRHIEKLAAELDELRAKNV